MWKYFTALLILLLFKIEDVANQEKLPKPGSNPDQGKPDNAPADPISAPLENQQQAAECYSLLWKMDCKFYECLNERLTCPQTLLAKGQRQVYCKAPGEKIPLWMEGIVECYMTKLRDIYTLVTVTCRFIDSVLIDFQKECYLENAFCTVGWANRDSLLKLFKKAKTKPVSHVYKTLWSNLSTVASNCSAIIADNFNKWFKEQESVL